MVAEGFSGKRRGLRRRCLGKGREGAKGRGAKTPQGQSTEHIEMAGGQAGLSVDSGRETGQGKSPCTMFKLLDV